MANQSIFTRMAVTRLRGELADGSSLASYLRPGFEPSEGEARTSIVELNGEMPSLSLPEANPSQADAENAIALYEYLGDLTEVQASDERLWAYLAHVDFRAYVQKRWPLKKEFTTGSAEDKAKGIRNILYHWFVAENDRELRRHALARLWWSAHLTRVPWERDPDYFGELERDDPYFYTRVLFSKQDIAKNFQERSMGRSNRILISLLNYIQSNEAMANSRDGVRMLSREVNLAFGVKKLNTLPLPALADLVSRLGDTVMANIEK